MKAAWKDNRIVSNGLRKYQNKKNNALEDNGKIVLIREVKIGIENTHAYRWIDR